MKDIDERFWYKMQSQQHHRRNISGIYIFDKFPDEEKRSPTCIEDCQQTTRRRWIMKRKDTECAKQAITMVYDAFLKLCEYLLAERCIEEESFADLTDMANRAKEELGYNWALHELASHLDVACDKLAMLADTFGVVRGGEE